MRAGSFDLTLTDATPGSVLDEVRAALGFTGDTSSWNPPDGHIVVVPTWQPVGGVSLTQAIYTGRLMMQNGKRSFSGKGLAVWLGGDGTPAWYKISQTSYSAKTLSELIGYIWSNFLDAGLTEGTITNPAGTKSTTHIRGTTPIEYLDHLSFIHGTQWRINPDGSLDAGTAANLFNTTPEVIVISDDLTAGGESVTVFSGEFADVQIDSSHIVAKVYAYGEGEGYTAINAAGLVVSSTAGGTRIYGFDGNAETLRIALDLPGEDNSTELTDAADEALATCQYPRISFDSITVNAGRVRDVLEPGDSVYIADEGSGLIDSANSVVVHGEVMNPLKLTVQRMTWDVAEGYGVYLRRHSGTETWTDLTPYVDLVASEDATTDLEVGDFQGLGDAAALQGHARFQPALVERLLR